LKKLLLVEDDKNLAEGLLLILNAKGYETVHAADGQRALDELNRGTYDLVLLDIMLPIIDGISVCKKARAQGDFTPILFLTARDAKENMIEGLLAGGDDYITKPFDIEELLARMHGIFRRNSWLSAEKSADTIYKFNGREIDFKSLKAAGPRGEFTLSKRECMVVKYLVEREGTAVGRDQLLDAIWGYANFPTHRTVDNFILKIRRIFEDRPERPVFFETVRGIGYRFVLPKKKRARS
jgi:two-component system alkaline phosphatase synthesis response regulator PhoP